MANPWDEAWEAREDDVWCPAARVTVAFGPMADDSARLVAQAPAMARLLLKGMTVTAAYDQNYETCLAGCGGYGPTAAEHDPDCALVVVLKAAGVLP